jgi:riboflavin biosynthesis pyrimidine reductase
MQPITTLLDRSPPGHGSALPPPLNAAYGGDLWLPVPSARPLYVAANFVSTLDGVASYQIAGYSGGGQISGFDPGDQLIMALLRSLADAVLIGSGTLHGDPGHVRTAEFICPSLRSEFRSFRQATLQKPIHPLNVVVTGSGQINLDEPTFHTPDLQTLIITTLDGYDRLRREHGPSLRDTEVRTTGDAGGRVSPVAALQILHQEFGVAQLLIEGGPSLFGQFLAEALIDELFLTLSPQVAGRDERHKRLGIVEHTLFPPDQAPWLDLVSLKMAGSHLYLRYRNRSRFPELT